MQLPQFDEVSHLAGRVKARAPLFGIGTGELEMLLAPLPPKETFEAKLRQLDAVLGLAAWSEQRDPAAWFRRSDPFLEGSVPCELAISLAGLRLIRVSLERRYHGSAS